MVLTESVVEFGPPEPMAVLKQRLALQETGESLAAPGRLCALALVSALKAQGG